MATGMAIMGFGGGAMVGSPLAQRRMEFNHTDATVGVWQTFLTMAAIHLVFMMGGAFGCRITPRGWQPDDWTPTVNAKKAMITERHVPLRNAHKTLSFWMIWLVLCMYVSAGIGVIRAASPMLQETFAGNLIGVRGVPSPIRRVSRSCRSRASPQALPA